MAKEVVTRIVSDLTGDPVPDHEAVTITIAFADPSRGKVQIDAAEGEVIDLISKGRIRVPRANRRRSRGSN